VESGVWEERWEERVVEEGGAVRSLDCVSRRRAGLMMSTLWIVQRGRERHRKVEDQHFIQTHSQPTHPRLNHLREIIPLHRPIHPHISKDHCDWMAGHARGAAVVSAPGEYGGERIAPECESDRGECGLRDGCGDEVKLELGPLVSFIWRGAVGSRAKCACIEEWSDPTTHIKRPPTKPPLPLPPRPKVTTQPRLWVQPTNERSAVFGWIVHST
jgi:hypothetical protein